MDYFSLPYRDDQRLFKNSAVYDFETICVKEETYGETEATKWVRKDVPISVSFSSNLITEPIFLCNSDPKHLIPSFISALESLATQSKAQLKIKFIEVETAIRNKLCSILGQLKQRHSQSERVNDCDDDEYFNDTAEEKELSTQFLQMQRNLLIDLQEHFERYRNMLPVFGFNSANYDINLIKSYLYQFLLMNNKLNQQLSKKLISFFPSSLVMCSYLIL